MKREDSQLVTVEDFYRRCFQARKPRLGKVTSKPGSRVRRRQESRDPLGLDQGPIKQIILACGATALSGDERLTPLRF